MSHEEWVSKSSSSFSAALHKLTDAVQRLDEGAAARTPAAGGWTAAQIAWHVGTTNEVLAGIITGDVPMAVPAAQGFAEQPGIFGAIPSKLQTFPQLEPPAAVTRAEGLARLRNSAAPVLSALQSLTSERATGYCVTFAFGTLSMYQLADFLTGHVLRHLDQVHRVTSTAASPTPEPA